MTANEIRLLLVEDSPDEAEIFRDLLGELANPSFHIEHCIRISEAELELERARFDLVLLDMNLPDSTGLAGFKRLHRFFPEIPIIILTSIKSESIAAQAVREGAQDYLVKREVDQRLLLRAVRYAIERHHAEERIRASEERYALAVAGANDGIWDWDSDTGRAYFSPRWKQLLGYSELEIGNHIEEWFSRVLPEDRPSLRETLRGHLKGDSAHFKHEHRIERSDGSVVWVLARGLAVRDHNGKPYRMAGSLTDISARKRAESQLLHDAMHDALTSLPNRNLLIDRLNQALRQYQRDHKRLFAVLFFDLDRFKNVNDSLGHSVGDALLCQVAKRLEKSLRPGDTLARLSGDEFAILLANIDHVGDATLVAERIDQLMEQGFQVEDHEVYASASVGIAPVSPQYRQPEEILRDADLAMYRAKRSPNQHFVVFGADMHAHAVRMLRMEMDLRRAMENHEFVLYYQPIISIDSGRVLGFEALIRWQHPGNGLMYPDDFIGVAEDTGLIVPMGWWALEEAARQLRAWQDLFPMDPPLAVSVNISGKLFRSPNMAERLLQIVREIGLPPETLRLEVTERSIMDHREAALQELDKLRDARIQLYMDDFGTGHSSLTNLRHFCYDTLKIDRSFLLTDGPGQGNRAIVEAIVNLGRTLDMNVIAEGVETPEQYQWLRALGCPEAQGFWISRPLERRDVPAMLQDREPRSVAPSS